MPEMTEAEKRFLIGLTKLTKETGIKIKGCGCCGSPFLAKCEGGKGYCFRGRGIPADVEWVNEGEVITEDTVIWQEAR